MSNSEGVMQVLQVLQAIGLERVFYQRICTVFACVLLATKMTLKGIQTI